MAGAAVCLSSCGSGKRVATSDMLAGEWNIIEVEGTAVEVSESGRTPFIGFDIEEGRLYGNSGCNRMMGALSVDAAPGRIELGRIAGTRMMCPDMTLEQNVLSALAQVKAYSLADGGNMALNDSTGRRVLLLERKMLELAGLDGKWMIEEAGGQAVPQDMETRPFLEFSVAEKTLHGNAGCNLVSGGFVTDAANPSSISFPRLASTMMAGPGMEVEAVVLEALDSVVSFGGLEKGRAGFYDADGNLVMVLARER